MPKADHHAILVAITAYPGIGALQGPEHDAAAFAEWLVKADGGDLPESNIVRMFSSAFAATSDPYGAQPTEIQFKQALERLLRLDTRDWKDRAGERLYLYFAGHGFTAGTLDNPALFTAEAQMSDPAHIAALVFAERIRRAGFFDEIVLVMDCCQDVLKSAPMPDTRWSPPDRQRTEPKLMVVIGAPRGRKSFEASDGKGPVRGYFSRAFLQALETADVDAEGWVTARAVEERLLQIWSAGGFLKKFKYEPPILAPRGMRLYRRAASPPVIPPSAGSAIPAAMPARPRRRPPSFGSMSAGVGAGAGGAAQNRLHLLQVRANDSGAAIDIMSADQGVIARGTGALKVSVPAGELTVRFRIGDERVEQRVNVPAQSLVEQPALTFSSPVPMPATSTFRMEQAQGAAAARVAMARGAAHAQAAVMVFLGETPSVAGSAEVTENLLHGSRLLRLEADSVPAAEALPTQLGSASGSWGAVGWSGLVPGHHLLGIPLQQGAALYWQELLVPAVPGYRTEVYLDGVEDIDMQGRPDLAGAAVLIVPHTHVHAPGDREDRETEVARLALMERYAGVDPARLRVLADAPQAPPLQLLYIAYALTHARELDVRLLGRLCDRLESLGFGAIGDVRVLRALISRHQGAPFESTLPPGTVPCMTRGWEICARIGLGIAPAMQRNVAVWRQAGASWTQVQVPDAVPRDDPSGSPLRAAIERALATATGDEDASSAERALRELSRAWLVDEELALASSVCPA